MGCYYLSKRLEGIHNAATPFFYFFFRAVTKKLAQLHTINPEKVPVVDKGGTMCTFDKTSNWENALSFALNNYPNELQDPDKSKL